MGVQRGKEEKCNVRNMIGDVSRLGVPHLNVPQTLAGRDLKCEWVGASWLERVASRLGGTLNQQ